VTSLKTTHVRPTSNQDCRIRTVTKLVHNIIVVVELTTDMNEMVSTLAVSFEILDI
jgi:hypothetical protein